MALADSTPGQNRELPTENRWGITPWTLEPVHVRTGPATHFVIVMLRHMRSRELNNLTGKYMDGSSFAAPPALIPSSLPGEIPELMQPECAAIMNSRSPLTELNHPFRLGFLSADGENPQLHLRKMMDFASLGQQAQTASTGISGLLNPVLDLGAYRFL